MIIKHLNLITIILLSAAQPSFGAFPVKHAVIANSTPIQTYEAATAQLTYSGSANPSRFANVINVFRPLAEHLNPEKRRSDTLGTLSLIFGIVGLLSFLLPVSIAAIILGAIGKKHHERHALAGLILGIIGIIPGTFLLLLAIG